MKFTIMKFTRLKLHPLRFPSMPRWPHRWLHRWRWRLLALLTIVFCLSFSPQRVMASLPVTPSLTASLNLAQAATSLEQQGRAAFAAGDYAAAAAAFAQAAVTYETEGNFLKQAQMLDFQADITFSQGAAAKAAEIWQTAATAYQQAGDPRRAAHSQVSQAQALQAGGFYGLAADLLTEMIENSQGITDITTVKALRAYGDILRLRGDLADAETRLQASLVMAQQLDLPDEIQAAYNSLGTLATAQNKSSMALAYYQQAAAVPGATSSLQAQVAQLPFLIAQADWPLLAENLPGILDQLDVQLPNRKTLYIQITLAKHLLKLREEFDAALTALETKQRAADGAADAVAELSNPRNPRQTELLVDNIFREDNQVGSVTGTEPAAAVAEPIPFLVPPDSPLYPLVAVLPTGDDIANLLLKAWNIAHDLGDRQGQAYALGSLGELYVQTQQWEIARTQTLAAIELVRGYSLPEVEYPLLAQLCTISQQLGNSAEALDACRGAVSTTSNLRNDLAAKGSDVAFDFQQRVEPIYRNFVDLLLQAKPDSTPDDSSLKEARDVIESLQLAELDNFFREACLEAKSVEVEALDPEAAVIYPILLPHRLDVIVSLPKTENGSNFRYYSHAVEKEVVQKLVSETRGNLTSNTPASLLRGKNQLKDFYDWLIAPIADDLENTQVKTLVFVLDEGLRNLPMSTLYDGEQYLIQKYAVVITPSLQLLSPTPLVARDLKVIAGGLTVEVLDFDKLPNVAKEIVGISEVLPHKVLLGQAFNREELQRAIATLPYPIVHLATHGQFGTTPEDTFIVTANEKLISTDFSQLLKNSELTRGGGIELLILSACKTASGDARSALGLAGLAMRSGARSTIASLWAVNDASTSELMRNLYSELISQPANKAEALRQAQLKLLTDPQGTYSHPYYWSPFILIGNWL